MRTPAEQQRLAAGFLIVAALAWITITWAVHTGRLPGLSGWWPGAAGFQGPGPLEPP